MPYYMQGVDVSFGFLRPRIFNFYLSMNIDELLIMRQGCGSWAPINHKPCQCVTCGHTQVKNYLSSRIRKDVHATFDKEIPFSWFNNPTAVVFGSWIHGRLFVDA